MALWLTRGGGRGAGPGRGLPSRGRWGGARGLMAAGGSRGDPLALGPEPEPEPEPTPAEGRWGDQESAAQVGRGRQIPRPWIAGDPIN